MFREETFEIRALVNSLCLQIIFSISISILSFLSEKLKIKLEFSKIPSLKKLLPMSTTKFMQSCNTSNLQKHFYKIILGITKLNLSLTRSKGTLAQLVEQRTENPCVPGSIPGGTT